MKQTSNIISLTTAKQNKSKKELRKLLETLKGSNLDRVRVIRQNGKWEYSA